MEIAPSSRIGAIHMRVAFLGLGRMGAAIAGNVLKAGHDLTVWNRSPDKADGLVGQGARWAATPREAVEGREIAITMLADDMALHAVLNGEDGLIAGLAPGALHISMSTIAVATADAVAARHAEAGQAFICAPVFGRPEAAAAAKLSVVAGGDAAQIERARPLLEAIGHKIFPVGDRPSAASLVKLCGNFTILAAIEAMGEALALAQKGGVPKALLLEVLTGALFDTPVYRNYGAALVKDVFEPAGFAAPLGLKDMRLVGEAAEHALTPMPLLSVLRDRLLQTIAVEGPDVDWSAIGRTSAKSAGL
jgi:3-hydroxyisobutyrate dehydrogenase-like beta-hydroxyacid dehydrogenase